MKTNALVLYRQKPAIVVQVDEKLEISLQDGGRVKVREKDVELLHPGPLSSFSQLEIKPVLGLAEAVELLDGAPTSLLELTGLVFPTVGPSEAWSVFLSVLGQWYEGSANLLQPISPEVREKRRLEAETKLAKQQEWLDALAVLSSGKWTEKEKPLLQEVEAFTLGRLPGSRVLKGLGKKETLEAAHYWLLQVGFWTPERDPWPERMGLRTTVPEIMLRPPEWESRKDLRDMTSFAIDDEGNQDPDDAVSWDGERLWVHVADAAHLVAPESEADREARERGATLYLPWTTSPMLPAAAVQNLGLGLSEVSPALSFGIKLDSDGTVEDVVLESSIVRVTRLSYRQADEQITNPDLAALMKAVSVPRRRRENNGALSLELPEVKIYLRNGRVEIYPVPPLESRRMVTEAMLLAGQGAALWASREALPFAFSTQEGPETELLPGSGLARQVALRKLLKKAVLSSAPGRHAGLGLESYSQVTSPLRRYLDLTLHQQIRRRLFGEATLSYEEISHRILIAEEASAKNRKCERTSRLHFTLLWHMQNPDWVGEAVVVDFQGNQASVIVPETALETKIPVKGKIELNQILKVKAKDISLPTQTLTLQVVEGSG